MPAWLRWLRNMGNRCLHLQPWRNLELRSHNRKPCDYIRQWLLGGTVLTCSVGHDSRGSLCVVRAAAANLLPNKINGPVRSLAVLAAREQERPLPSAHDYFFGARPSQQYLSNLLRHVNNSQSGSVRCNIGSSPEEQLPGTTQEATGRKQQLHFTSLGF